MAELLVGLTHHCRSAILGQGNGMDGLLRVGRIFEQASHLPKALSKLGVLATAGLLRTHAEEYGSLLLGLHRTPSLRSVRPNACAAPIHFRAHTTDINVLQQVFLSGDYECVRDEKDVRTIVDCGANIGCASVWFLNRYPEARVVAVEADLGNFDVCRANLARYGDRAVAIHGAVWPREEPLTVERGEQEWAFSVRPCRPGEIPEVSAVTLESLGNIDLLKIDIEGGEEALFGEDCSRWLERTRTIVIELHGPACRTAFLRAIAPHGFRVEDAAFGVAIARRA
jgi:FkbM family methyltransferase